MNAFDDRYTLTGKFLVAMPSINNDSFFEKSVVYVCSHGSTGAMGIVINKRLNDFTFSDLTFQMPVKNYENLNNVNLYSGGPLEKVRGLVLHSSEYVKDGTIVVGNGIAISSSTEIITDIAYGKGPKDKLVALGYSFWQPRQLEAEICDNHWLVTDANTDLIFQTSDENKWQKALNETGIRLDSFVENTGHA